MKNFGVLAAIVAITLALPMEAQIKEQGETQTTGALKATATSGHSVALTCTPPSSGTKPTGYFFYRGATAGGESATPLNATQTTTCAYTDSTVLGNTTYFYTAKSNCSTCNPASISGPSNEVQVNVPADTAPNPPTGLATGAVSLYHAPLLWNAPVPQSGYTVARYKIYRGGNPALPNPSLIASVDASILSYTDTKCIGTKYYEIRAYDYKTASGPGVYYFSAPSNIVQAICQ